jgi:hypothetical protein
MAEGHYMYITVLTTARHWSIFRVKQILTPPCHLRLCLPSGLLPSGLPSEILCPLPVTQPVLGSRVSLRNVTSFGEGLHDVKMDDRPLSAVRD